MQLPYNIQSPHECRMIGIAGSVFLEECADDPTIEFMDKVGNTLAVFPDDSVLLSPIAGPSEIWTSTGDFLADCMDATIEPYSLEDQLRNWCDCEYDTPTPE